jgi:hypothetical protein
VTNGTISIQDVILFYADVVLGVGEAMRRREFITLAGATAVACPLIARAQQGEPLRRVGVLEAISKDTPGAQRYTAFLQAFEQLGWTDGQNVRIVARWGGGNEAETRKYAKELIALDPDVILAGGSTVTEVMLKATRTVPIEIVVGASPTAFADLQEDHRAASATKSPPLFGHAHVGQRGRNHGRQPFCCGGGAAGNDHYSLGKDRRHLHRAPVCGR